MSVKAKHFPFPFTNDRYEYSNNSSILDPAQTICVTDEYVEEVNLKRKLLREEHQRCFRSMSISMESQWEVLYLIFRELARKQPDHFSLEQRRNEYVFQNQLLGEEVHFVYRDPSSIEIEPLDLAGRHVQEDLIIMGDRNDGLYLEAGQLCFPSNWSLTFVQGMDFKSIHTPVPGISANGFLEKVERFISRIRPGAAWERKNWSITVTDKLDTPLETYSDWGRHRYQVDEENAGEMVHLRVEVQRLYRLPMNNDILFSIHTYLLSLQELIKNKTWLNRFYHNIRTLPEEITEYKGILTYRASLLRYLENQINKGNK